MEEKNNFDGSNIGHCKCGSNAYASFDENIKGKEPLKLHNEVLRQKLPAYDDLKALPDEKIEEYAAAICERDEVILQLQCKLEDCIQQKNELITEIGSQQQKFSQDFELLEKQVKDSASSLRLHSRSCSNHKDYKELQTKLLEVQHMSKEERKTYENTIKQLKLKTEEFISLEKNFYLLKQSYNNAKESHLQDISDYANEVECLKDRNLKLEKDILNTKNSYSQHLEQLQAQLQELTATNKYLEAQMEEEENRLRVEVQDLKDKLCSSVNELDTQKIESEQRLHDKLKEMKDLHHNEIALIYQQIDVLEKNQKDHEQMNLDLSGLASYQKRLQKDLEIEKQKVLTLSLKLEESERSFETLKQTCRTLEENYESAMKSKIKVLETENLNLMEVNSVQSQKFLDIQKELEAEVEAKNNLKLALAEREASNIELKKSDKFQSSRIVDLETELKTEKDLKNELNLALQEAILVQETLKQDVIYAEKTKDAFENDNKIITEELQVAQMMISKVHLEIEEMRQSKNSLEEQIKEFQFRINECDALRKRIGDINEIIMKKFSCSTNDIDLSIVGSEMDDVIKLQRLVNVVIEYKNMTEVVKLKNEEKLQLNKLKKDGARIVNRCAACQTLALSEDSESQTCLPANEDCESQTCLPANEDCESQTCLPANEDCESQTCLPANEDCESQTCLPANEDCESQTCLPENEDRESQTCSPTNEDSGSQTCSPTHSSGGLISTQTIEEDFMIEEVIIFNSSPVKDADKIKQIPITTLPLADVSGNTLDMEELRKKLYDCKFVIKSLENENSTLRMALKMKDDSRTVSDKTDEAKVNGNKEVIGGYLENQLKMLEDKYKIQQLHIQSLENIIQEGRSLKNTCEETSNKCCNSCKLLLKDMRLKLIDGAEDKLKILEKWKCTVEFIGKLNEENANLKRMVQGDVNSGEQSMISEGEKVISPECDVMMNILEVELKVQALLSQYLNEELRDINKDDQNSEKINLDWIKRCLEPICKKNCSKHDMIDLVARNWLDAISKTPHKSNPIPVLDRDRRIQGGSDVKSLLESNEQLLRYLLEMEMEGRKSMKELENRLVSSLDKLLNCPEMDNKNVSQSNASHFDVSSNLDDQDEPKASPRDQLLKEFEDITLSIVNVAQEEKIELLDYQSKAFLKILRGSQHKISQICQGQVDKIKDTSTEPGVENLVSELVESIEASLAEEYSCIEGEYADLMQQYSYEQSLHSQTNSLTLLELKDRIAMLLQQPSQQERDASVLGQDFTNDRLTESLAAKSSFTNLETHKQISNALIQITLNLLHYYAEIQDCSQNSSANHYNSKRSPKSQQDEAAVPLGSLLGELDCSIEPDEIIPQNLLDNTGGEGMLEDLEKDERIKKVLSSTCPNLILVLKNKLEDVSIVELGKEVQEFVIALQASAGMFQVAAMSSKASMESTEENSCLQELTQYPNTPLFLSPLANDTYSISVETRSSSTLVKYSSPVDDTLKNLETLLELSEHLERELSSQSLAHAEVDSIQEFTTLRSCEQPQQERIMSFMDKLAHFARQREILQKNLHQTRGLLIGILEEKSVLEQEKNRLDSQVLALLAELENYRNIREQFKAQPVSQPPINKSSPTQMKEKVKAVLAAKDREYLEQKELVARVRELEVILEEVVREREELVDEFANKIADLTQQLEVADRQVKVSRQFLDEQATERDQEFEILARENEKLIAQLREKDVVIKQHLELKKEMAILEKELKEKTSRLDQARDEKDAMDAELKGALDKVRDLRDVIHSQECQLSARSSSTEILNQQIKCLMKELQKERETTSSLNLQLHERRQGNVPLGDYPPNEFDSYLHDEEGAYRQLRTGPITKAFSTEIGTRTVGEQCNSTREFYMLQQFSDMLQRSLLSLEDLQFETVDGEFDEELSVKDQLELNDTMMSEASRTLSPSSLERKLEEKFEAFERTTEAAIKYTRDLVKQLAVLKTDFDEVVLERDELSQQLTGLRNLKGELEKASEDYKIIKKEFEITLPKLQKELLESEERVKKVETEKSSLESLTEELKGRETKTAEENRGLLQNVKEMEDKLTKIKNLENKLTEVAAERDFLQCQNTEQLMRISSQEARLEEMKRAQSPQDLELKGRIQSLQEDLEKSQVQLRRKYTEIEELEYTVKELRDHLMLREEELAKMNQEVGNLRQPISDAKMAEIRDLRKKVLAQNDVIEQLKEGLRSEGRIASQHALSVDGDKYEMSYLNPEVRNLKQLSLLLDPLIREGHSPEDILEMLRNLEGSWQLHTEKPSDGEEVQRSTENSTEAIIPSFLGAKVAREGMGGSCGNISEASNVSSMPSHSSNLCFESSLPHKDVACQGDLPEDSETLIDGILTLSDTEETRELKAHISILENEIRGLTDYQEKLEEDYEKVQEMLEMKEEEIMTLNEEAGDDAPSLSPIKELQNYQEKLDIMIRKSEALEMEYDLCLEKIDNQKKEINALHESMALSKTELGELSKKANQMEAEAEQLRQSEGKLRSEVEILHQREATLLSDLDSRSKACEQSEAQIIQLQDEMKVLKIELKRMENLLQQRDGEVEDLTVQLGQLKTEVEHFHLTGIGKGKGDSTEASFVSLENGISDRTREDLALATEGAQKLISKLHAEGVQVLSLTECLTLKDPAPQVGSPEASTLNPQDAGSEVPQAAALNLDPDNGGLIRHISDLKKELVDRENQIEDLKRKTEQVLSLHSELWEMLSIERKESDLLTKKLQLEVSKNFPLTVENSQIKAQVAILERRLQTAQEELMELRETEKQKKDFEFALNVERSNFRKVSSTLSHQRHLSKTALENKERLIQDLRCSLEKEREKVTDLVKGSSLIPPTDKLSLVEQTKNGLSSFIIEKELHLRNVLDQEFILRKKLQEEEESVGELKEELEAERVKHLKEVAELEKSLAYSEGQRKSLMEKLQNKEKMINELKIRIMSSKKSDLPVAKSPDHSDHTNYTNALKKLNEKEIEIVELTRRLTATERELRLYKEILSSDLHDGVVDGVRATEEEQDSNNDRENRMFSEIADFKDRFLSLEALVRELGAEVNSKVGSSEENQRRCREAERAAGDAERSLLQLKVSSLEAKNRSLRRELEEFREKLKKQRIGPEPNQSLPPESINRSLRYLSWKHRRSESYRKSLIYQKKYLLSLLEIYRVTEAQTLDRLLTMATNIPHSGPEKVTKKLVSPSVKFKSAAFVLISIKRMKFLVKRWKLSKQLQGVTGSSVSSPDPVSRGSASPQPSYVENEREAIGSAGVSLDVAGNGAPFPITGTTPPTKDAGLGARVRPKNCYIHQRNLFGISESSSLDDYVERVDNIHSRLGFSGGRRPC